MTKYMCCLSWAYAFSKALSISYLIEMYLMVTFNVYLSSVFKHYFCVFKYFSYEAEKFIHSGLLWKLLLWKHFLDSAF